MLQQFCFVLCLCNIRHCLRKYTDTWLCLVEINLSCELLSSWVSVFPFSLQLALPVVDSGLKQAGPTTNMLKTHHRWNRHWCQHFQCCFHFTFLFPFPLHYLAACGFSAAVANCIEKWESLVILFIFLPSRSHSSALVLLTCDNLPYLRIAYVTESTLSKCSCCQATVLSSLFCFSQTKW